MKAWNEVQLEGRVLPTSRETVIAGELVGKIWSVKQRDGCPVPFAAEEETGTRGVGDRAPSGRVDIKLRSGYEYHDFLLIECKRVHGKKRNLARKYVEEGVMRFVSGKYAPGHGHGVMMGFAVDRDATAAAGLIEDVLSTHAPAETHSAWSADNSWRLSVTPHRTEHRQQTGAASHVIAIIHLVVDI
jgi:hypothetical protein